MYAATGGPNVKWGAGTTAPLAGDGPASHALVQSFSE